MSLFMTKRCHFSEQNLITQQPVDLEKISRCQNDRLGLLLAGARKKGAKRPEFLVIYISLQNPDCACFNLFSNTIP